MLKTIGWFLLAGIIVGAWLSVWILLPQYYPKDGAAGQLGDSFGLLTCLFGGLTLLGAAYAAVAQRQQVLIAKEQLKEQVDSSREQRANQAEELAIARAQAAEDGRQRARAEELQQAQAVAQRLSAELNAYLAMAGYFAGPGKETRDGSGEMLRALGFPGESPDRALQMARVMLAEIQNPDPGFDWKTMPQPLRTSKIKYLLVMLRQIDTILRTNGSMPARSDATMDTIARNFSNEIMRMQSQQGLSFAEIGWMRDIQRKLEAYHELSERGDNSPNKEDLRVLFIKAVLKINYTMPQ